MIYLQWASYETQRLTCPGSGHLMPPGQKIKHNVKYSWISCCTLLAQKLWCCALQIYLKPLCTKKNKLSAQLLLHHESRETDKCLNTWLCYTESILLMTEVASKSTRCFATSAVLVTPLTALHILYPLLSRSTISITFTTHDASRFIFVTLASSAPVLSLVCSAPSSLASPTVWSTLLSFNTAICFGLPSSRLIGTTCHFLFLFTLLASSFFTSSASFGCLLQCIILFTYNLLFVWRTNYNFRTFHFLFPLSHCFTSRHRWQLLYDC